jgi:hypothetical protein
MALRIRRTGLVTLSVSEISSDSLSTSLFLSDAGRLGGPEVKVAVVELPQFGRRKMEGDG